MPNELAADADGARDAPASRQLLTFTIQDEEYGIDILFVQEIKGFTRITPVPNAPHFVKGVLNLRGTVVPTIDLRARFNMPEKAYDQFSVVIVVNVGSRVVGLLVDAVSDVLELQPADVSATPDIAGGTATCCSAMGRLGDRIVMILDLDLLLDAVELRDVEGAAA